MGGLDGLALHPLPFHRAEEGAVSETFALQVFAMGGAGPRHHLHLRDLVDSVVQMAREGHIRCPTSAPASISSTAEGMRTRRTNGSGRRCHTGNSCARKNVVTWRPNSIKFRPFRRLSANGGSLVIKLLRKKASWWSSSVL